jgi:D-alanyl-D-alanine carboxypeptidase
MLLQHNSGINDYDDVIFATLEQILANREYTPWELAAIGLAQPRVGEPGQVWSYANTNYVLAGLVLERVTGRDAAAEITQRIIRPLGLRDTYFPGSSPVIRGKHANGYVPWTDGLRDFTVYRNSWVWMAGDLISTTVDLNRFYRALLGGRLLRPAQLAEMRRTVPTDPAAPDASGYGLGLLRVPTPCGLAWGHNGIVFGYATTSLHSADGRRQVTIATNISHYQESLPIDAASGAFQVAALCGPTQAGLATPAGGLGRTAGPVLPRR